MALKLFWKKYVCKIFNYLCKCAYGERKHGDFEILTSIFVFWTIRPTRLPCPLTVINKVIKFFTCLMPWNLVRSLWKLISFILVVFIKDIFLSLVNGCISKRVVRNGRHTRTTANWLYTWLEFWRQFHGCLPFAKKQTVVGGGFLLHRFCVTSTTDTVLLLFLDMCVPASLLRSRIPAAIVRLGVSLTTPA